MKFVTLMLAGFVVSVASVYFVDGFTLRYRNVVFDPIGIGAVIAPRAPLLLRVSPPGGLLGLKGNAIGKIDPSERFVVVDEKDVRSVQGIQKWLRVHSADDKNGWVFSGFANTDPARNVALVASGN